jgi:hypothetical protein
MPTNVFTKRPPSLPPTSSSAPPLPRAPMPPLRAVPPPLPPHLVSVPPPPPRPMIDEAARTLPFDDPTVLDDRPGALMKHSTVVRLFGDGRALVVRLFERMRVMQQMRSAVAIQRSPSAMPAIFDAARVNKVVV